MKLRARVNDMDETLSGAEISLGFALVIGRVCD